MLGGVALAGGAALAYEGGYVLQALAARRLDPAAVAGPGLLGALVRQRVFLLSAAFGVAGFGLQVLALHHAPLAVVQPVLALGVVLLLVMARVVLGERPTRRDLSGAVAIAAGAAAVATLAGSERHAPALSGDVVLALLSLLALAPLVIWRRRAWWLVSAAASADVLVALAGARAADAGALTATLAWLVVAGLAALAALTDESAALRELPAVRVGTSVLAAQALAPVLLAPLVAGQSWPSGELERLGTVAGLAALVAGIVVLVSSPTLVGFTRAEAQRG